VTDWIAGLRSKEARVCSQGGQDGVLAEIFSHIGTENSPPFCVEFGFNSDSFRGGTGANVGNLVLYHGWRWLLFDGDYENAELNLHRHHLTSTNICELLRQYGCPPRPDYVSIDVDSTDLWLMDAVLHDFRPRVLSCEYNCNFPIEFAITHPDAESLYRGRFATYGASLKALDLVGRRHGYSLVHVVSKLDAFFVRDDLVAGHSVPDLEFFAEHTGIQMHHRVTDESDRQFLCYETFIRTGGDADAARAAAAEPAKQYLAT
jgi:hypothetical protein